LCPDEANRLGSLQIHFVAIPKMAKRVAELLVEVLAAAGVQRIYGVAGDPLNGITDSVAGSDRRFQSVYDSGHSERSRGRNH
jgi:hypothetical protein